MSEIILIGSAKHNAHINGVICDESAAQRAEGTESKKADLRAKIAGSKATDKQELTDELARLERGDADYNAGFREGINRGKLSADAGPETKDGYSAGLEASKKAPEKPKTDVSEKAAPGGETLKQDGPTVAQYVAAGYDPKTYPPAGYSCRSTPEEIKKSIGEYKPK